MSSPPHGSGQAAPNRARQYVEAVGQATFEAGRTLHRAVSLFGGLCYLLADAVRWTVRGTFLPKVKLGRPAVVAQMVRVGVRAIPIIVLVQLFIGVILALAIAPTLEMYGQVDTVAIIVAIAVFRELGPLISAILLSGFAGASIAAEIGSMVESEEIKALRAHALNPIHFLVVPRYLATVVMLTGLAVLADVTGVAGGMFTGVVVLGVDPTTYLQLTQDALTNKDFVTGLIKAAVFGLLIAMLACYEGLNVSGGAEGVGRATTQTVVKSIVALIATDCVFTTIFYVYEI
ncbi:MAG: ABC transporter permease [Phycisphaerae bacterium]|nr:ABC transporter permease [Phycisphaerae bacterium]